MKNVLYLASQSTSRQKLLATSGIPFQIVSHMSDECSMPRGESFQNYVTAIAQDKVKNVVLPDNAVHHEQLFVLTADTLVRICDTDSILGKPENREDAKRMVRLMRDTKVEVVTGCCLERKKRIDDSWQTDVQRSFTTSSHIEFCVSEKQLDWFIDNEPASLLACGAAVIEGHGQNFLKSIEGSYSSVMGLPLFELRQELNKLSFFK